MATLTNRNDVIATFVRYHGRQPNPDELKAGGLIDHLITKAPQEVESLLAKNSPITKGKLWAEHQASLASLQPTQPETPTQSTQLETPAQSTQGYDPFAEASKYGYSKDDFANDPNFYEHWKNKTPAELKAELEKRGDYDIKQGGREQTIDEAADSGLTDGQKASISEGHNWIDEMIASGQVDEGQAAILHEIFAGDYTSGQKIPSTEEINGIIADAAKNAEIDLNPYYEKMEYRDMQDIRQSLADIRSGAEREATREKADYKSQLASTKQSLRQRGMTFSGASRQKLGQEGALQAQGIEGELPGARRLGYEERTAGYQRQARDIGQAAERRWGTGMLTGIGQDGQPLDNQAWLSPYNNQGAFGSVWTPSGQESLRAPWLNDWQKAGDRRYEQGDMRAEREREIEKDKWNRVSKYRSYS